MKTFLFSIVLLFSGLFLQSQNYSRYTLETLVDMLGRTQYSPKLDLLASDVSLKKSEVKNSDGNMQGLWYNGTLSLFFTGDDHFGKNLHVLKTIGFHLEEVKSNNIPILEPGFLGITAFMRRSKVDKILKTIDPDYVNDGQNKAWADYKDDYRIKVQFNGEKNSSQVLRVYVYLNEDKYMKHLKQDFIDFGPGVLMPLTVTNRYYRTNKDPMYINVIPPKGCEACFATNQHSGSFTFPDGKTFKGKLNGMMVKKATVSFPVEGKTYQYDGSFIFGEASGNGVLTDPDANTINGIWENGAVISVIDMAKDGFTYSGKLSPDFKMSGQGTVTSGDFSCEGKYLNDQIQKETNYIIRQDGNVYIGWINESYEPNGQGRFTLANNDTHNGNFVNGDFHSGQVNATLDNGSRYKGEYSNNQMHGQGTLTFTDGQVVSGTFSNGQYNGGTGTLAMEEGSTYTGEVNNQMKAEGKGKYTYPNGDYIICNTKNGVYTNAEGRRTLGDGAIYTGQLNANMLPDGKGRVNADEGVYIEGTFSNNTFLGGKGFIKYENGTAYKGEMDGEKNPKGNGTYYYKYNSDYVIANFNKTGVISGYGERHFADGTIFKGHLDSQGNPNGQGTAHFGNGITVTGKFVGSRPTGTVSVVDGQQTWEGPVDDQYRPNGKGRFRTSTYAAWQNGTFSHGKKQ